MIAWLGIWFGISITSGGVWSYEEEQNSKTEEEHDEDCIEEGFQLDSVKFDRAGERGRDALGMGNFSINIWGRSEPEIVLSKKNCPFSIYEYHYGSTVMFFFCFSQKNILFP